MNQINNSTSKTILSFQAPEGARETGFSSCARVSALAVGSIAAFVGVLALCGMPVLSALGTVGGATLAGVGGTFIMGSLVIKQIEADDENSVAKAIAGNVRGFFKRYNAKNTNAMQKRHDQIEANTKEFFTKHNNIEKGVKEFFSKHNNIEKGVKEFFSKHNNIEKGVKEFFAQHTLEKESTELLDALSKRLEAFHISEDSTVKEQAAGKIIANACAAYIKASSFAGEDLEKIEGLKNYQLTEDFKTDTYTQIFNDFDHLVFDAEEIQLPQVSSESSESVEVEQPRRHSTRTRRAPTVLSYTTGFKQVNSRKN